MGASWSKVQSVVGPIGVQVLQVVSRTGKVAIRNHTEYSYLLFSGPADWAMYVLVMGMRTITSRRGQNLASLFDVHVSTDHSFSYSPFREEPLKVDSHITVTLLDMPI